MIKELNLSRYNRKYTFYVVGDGYIYEGAYFTNRDKAVDYYNKRKDTVKLVQLDLWSE